MERFFETMPFRPRRDRIARITELCSQITTPHMEPKAVNCTNFRTTSLISHVNKILLKIILYRNPSIFPCLYGNSFGRCSPYKRISSIHDSQTDSPDLNSYFMSILAFDRSLFRNLVKALKYTCTYKYLSFQPF